MMSAWKRPLLGLIAAVLAAPAVAAADPPRPDEIRYHTPGPVPMLSRTYQTDKPVRILLTDDRLSPRRVELRAGQTLRWLSYARDPSSIQFEREVAAAMICHSLVNFSLHGDELRSAPLKTGDSAGFCELAPGTYRYRVIRDSAGDRPSRGGINLSSRLEGVIVVRGSQAGVAAR